MVLPERLIPGKMAPACAKPITIEAPTPTELLGLDFTFCEIAKIAAVTISIAPTKELEARPSIWSLKAKPMMAAGIALKTISPTYFRAFSPSSFFLKKPVIKFKISSRKTTIVLKAVAPCTRTEKVKSSSGS